MTLLPDELETIAAYLHLAPEAFTARYTRLRHDRRGLSLTEKEDGSCIFLQKDNTCRIHPVKPRQCVDFPDRWTFDGWERLCGAKRHE